MDLPGFRYMEHGFASFFIDLSVWSMDLLGFAWIGMDLYA